MSPPTVVLHIGAMKTGTTYLQSIFDGNEAALTDSGVFWPGPVRSYQRHAVRDLLDSAAAGASPSGRWAELVERVLACEKPLAVVSMEFLSFADQAAAERAVRSFAAAHVRVVLTLRDLGRTIPAQWQESTQNMNSWTYTEYLQGLETFPEHRNRPGRHFWRRQNWPAIVRTWQPFVDADDLRLVTVPAPGAPKDALWERFCTALEISPEGFTLPAPGNESLGLTSAELMRGISEEAHRRGLTAAEFDPLRTTLAKRILARRRDREPPIRIPVEQRPWIVQRSRQLIDELAVLDHPVIGDLADLQPQWPDSTETTGSSDPSSDMLAAAIDGLIELASLLDDDPKRSRSASNTSTSS